MDRVVILGMVAALSCASASQVFGQLGPLGPTTPAYVPGGAPVAPGFGGYPTPTPGYYGVADPYAGQQPPGWGQGGLPPQDAGFPAEPQPYAPPPASYVSPMPPPRAPQNLGLYRPSMPEGVEARKLSPLPSVSVREFPYLRRGQSTDKFITPPGMEMPEAVGPTSAPTTWRDRLRSVLDPLGMLGL